MFDRTAYEKHDEIGKQVSLRFFGQFGWISTDMEEHYGDYDFLMTKRGIKKTVEVEQKTGWTSHNFPFQTMDVPGRKMKSKADYFVQINKYGTALHITKMSDVHRSKQYTKTTCCAKGYLEPFFAVSLTDVDTYWLIDNKWVHINQRGSPQPTLLAL